MHEIGQKIRRLREERAWNQAQLAVAAGIGVSAVSLIETGKRNPSATTLAKMADALGVEVADFFPKKAQAPLPMPLDSPVDGAAPDDERSLHYLRAFRAFIHAYARSWEEVPPENWREIAPLYEALIAVLGQGVLEPSWQVGPKEVIGLELLADGLERLHNVAKKVGNGEEPAAVLNFREALERRKREAS